MASISYEYRFRLPEGHSFSHTVQFDSRSLEIAPRALDKHPHWIALDFYRCPHCPLQETQHPQCPAAVQLVPVVSLFNRLASYDQIDVEIECANRRISARTSTQRALRSLLGLILAVSGCPHTGFFKPMARFHLPFSDDEETIYRATSMYMLAQFFRSNRNLDPSYSLEGLKKIYHRLHLVNRGLAQRLRVASSSDSALNGIVLLDIFTKSLPDAIEGELEYLQHLFAPFLDCHETDGTGAGYIPI